MGRLCQRRLLGNEYVHLCAQVDPRRPLMSDSTAVTGRKG